MLEILLQNACNLNDKDEYGQTPIYYASRENRIDTVKCVISLGGDVNNVDMHGQTCMFYAAKNGKTDVCRVLIDNGANVHHIDNKGQTPVMGAHKAKKTEVNPFSHYLDSRVPCVKGSSPSCEEV